MSVENGTGRDGTVHDEPECGEMSGLARDKTPEPVSRDQIQARTGSGKKSFSLFS